MLKRKVTVSFNGHLKVKVKVKVEKKGLLKTGMTMNRFNINSEELNKEEDSD